jgi:DNA-binding transcriptional LysR family regulator
VVSAIRKRHPGLRFYIREAGSTATAAAVASGELDLGIITLPLRSGDSLLTTPLVDDEFRLIVPPRHRLLANPLRNRRTTFRWPDLAGESLIAFEAGTAVRDLIDRASAAAGIHLNVVMELRSIESIKQMVAAGIGVGFISRFALKPGEGLAAATGKLSRKLAIVRANDRLPSAAAAEFERVLIEMVR